MLHIIPFIRILSSGDCIYGRASVFTLKDKKSYIESKFGKKYKNVPNMV
jgi:hypothetical protein